MVMKEEVKKITVSTSPCAQLTSSYHQCFNKWYLEKFLKGEWDKEECVTEWEKYRACLSKHFEVKQLARFLEEEADAGFPKSNG
ncbi:hypothetical protein MKW94_008669 [Papaver nudicaule]|uniref:Uncharacterized protein n=1 Tax=Papaver nudicaule TaxID=74823 RepID=A0AA41VMU4_PAPNU|nr:hypothetical protein [Papaver nudicaule]